MTTVLIDSNDTHDITSYVTVRHARYNYTLAPRSAEIAGIDRRAFGGRQTATDSAAETSTKQNDLLRCSDCKQDKHYDLFPLSKVLLYRHAVWVEEKKNGKKVGQLCGHGYRCKQCRHIRYEQEKEAALHLAMFEARQAKQARLSKKQKKRAKSKLDKIA